MVELKATADYSNENLLSAITFYAVVFAIFVSKMYTICLRNYLNKV